MGFKWFCFNFGICVDYCLNGVFFVFIFVDFVVRFCNDDFIGCVILNDKGYIICLFVEWKVGDVNCVLCLKYFIWVLKYVISIVYC